ncbi:GNAT family N-acetyltransferase [Litoreibacter arenae]|uniref:GCN5-related N-acetyltransferase n=1 Tax=Litoreibacter arenae DSM 19593 TaxID=1123360 RepID=S9RS77_9RHOB|nr:N-acetyltransferase [Litoreibacter arenae]EPX80925.1 GCN5-related N-acetyltransferase [Litoreibacter arenae DSM 19593]
MGQLSTATLRTATPADASSLAALALEVWLSTYIRHGINAHFADFALAHFTPERFKSWIEDPDHRLIVSQNRDGIDGFIHIGRNSPDPVGGHIRTELTSLYIQPRHQGRGLGKALLDAALDQADHPVWLAVNCENTKARAFYKTQGFSKLGETAFRIGDKSYPNDVLMRQPL